MLASGLGDAEGFLLFCVAGPFLTQEHAGVEGVVGKEKEGEYRLEDIREKDVTRCGDSSVEKKGVGANRAKAKGVEFGEGSRYIRRRGEGKSEEKSRDAKGNAAPVY